MDERQPGLSGHRSSAVPLALAWIALIVYASLYPFGPWRVPTSFSLPEALTLPVSHFSSDFDRWSNLLGYLPLGALLFVGRVRSGGGIIGAAFLALFASAALSYSMELTQGFLPRRVPSRLDFTLNGIGAALGALLAWIASRVGVVDRWHRWRERWFVGRSASVIALLLLWPVGLLFPWPVPFGLGDVLDLLRELAVAALADTPWASLTEGWDGPMPMESLSPPAELLAMVLGLLAPCVLAFSIARPGWRRLLLVAGGLMTGVAVTTLSTALNFGPQHALDWITPRVTPALLVALALSATMAWLPRRVAAGIGLVVVTGLVAIVAHAPADPYYASSLQAWEQGRFIRFHGLARWIGWLWPYAAMLALLAQLSARERS